MKVRRQKGFFSISAVAKMFSVHQQTIRMYEKQGFVTPKRSSGNTRLFSEEDIDRLEEIIYLTHELGINLAGVEMILKLKKQINKMQRDMNKIFDATQKELDKEVEQPKQLVKKSAQRLMEIKQRNAPESGPTLITDSPESDAHEADLEAIDEWEVAYDPDDE